MQSPFSSARCRRHQQFSSLLSEVETLNFLRKYIQVLTPPSASNTRPQPPDHHLLQLNWYVCMHTNRHQMSALGKQVNNFEQAPSLGHQMRLAGGRSSSEQVCTGLQFWPPHVISTGHGLGLGWEGAPVK